MKVQLITDSQSSQFAILQKYGIKLYSDSDMRQLDLWNFRVIDANNGVVIIPQNRHSIRNAWFVGDDCNFENVALCVFHYNARAKGDAEGNGVVRKFFAPYIGMVLVEVESRFLLTLPTHHSHNVSKHYCRVTVDGKFVNEDYPPYHRLLRIPEDLPVFGDSSQLPVNLFGITKGSGYMVKEYDEGTFVRVDSRLKSQWLAEVFIKKEDYGKVSVGIYSPSWEFDNFYASVKESAKPMVYEYCDKHGSRLLIVSPRNNEFVISGGISRRYYVDEDGKISEVK